MKLAIPVSVGGKIYTDAEIKKPRTIVLANTYETMRKTGDFMAILELINGSTESFTSDNDEITDDEKQIKRITREMSFITAELLSLEIMGLLNVDDKIEGVYPCPRCGTKIITEYDARSGEDTRDRFSDLEKNYYDGELEDIHIDLDTPVKRMDKRDGSVLEEVESVEMVFPTMHSCIKSESKFGQGKEIKRQLYLYGDSITKINEAEIDEKWRKMWGEWLFTNMEPQDVKKVSDELQKYGIKRTVRRVCRECGKEWDSVVNTSNFFVSGLQSI